MTVSQVLVGDDGSLPAAAARSWAERLAAATSSNLDVVRIDPDTEHSVAAELLAAAVHLGSDLVVVGRRGQGGFAGLRLGSTAHQVAEHSPVPVAVVPSPAPRETQHPVLSRLAVGVDGSPGGEAALAWATSLAVDLLAVVWAVHAVDVAPALAAAGIGGAGYANAIAAAAEVMRRDWCAPLRDAGVRYETVIAEGGPAGVLLDAAQTAAVDLVVAGRNRSADGAGKLMGSVAHRLIAFAPCPAVVVPAG